MTLLQLVSATAVLIFIFITVKLMSNTNYS